ncbi:hypothetical protein A2X44_02710 [candidate division CPR3 bacterium GWF2_35_18]|uniref:Uncharacterized protein n=1 Tax=candidate division CPR3 bacterium GW2011_GWF2_35_18 TaxID=1618350 RepID=A0A0G0BZI7_UNCC3|nr:MAG: hypothetical protein UR67_C0008G0032 [candidate division CPR3 bacterium GW2011_GWF2_35_18]KKP86877.1 MAG: hypothetical protein UR87_C0009G0006 [candidate division CPR3 bacterium GW2011_GWE2_35_7]OGB62502.1 MAG: hypothetical protein A2X44_02710 [candidate division CPR3 bacterium GWF2_35_18]OGB65546.1 MAG: hypothetical protein A2250_04290 [candidate division CPR3 bacterium RIFOXYA2_FULL_35_13]OGB76893.1 MAG: hypothetical protein A2476_03655 [candidate division CPR3 bacterium RIFOXYC2_FULL
MERKTKGLFLKNIVNIIKKEKGEPGIQKLKEKVGQVDFFAFKDYPMELDVKFAKASCEILYGTANDEAYINLGKLAFQTYTKSVIGKTMFSLIGNNLYKGISNLGKMLSTVTSGFEITVQELDSHTIKIRTKNNPYHIKHYQGIWLAAFEYFGVVPQIDSRTISPENFEYLIKW